MQCDIFFSCLFLISMSVTQAAAKTGMAEAGMVSNFNSKAEAGMVSNSNLLQERFFRDAISEVAQNIPFVVGVNHKAAKCMVELCLPASTTRPKSQVRRTYSIIFPMKRLELIKALWIPDAAQRKYRYCFRGLLQGGSPRKQWVKNYVSSTGKTEENHIEHNLHGRSTEKYTFDSAYFSLMCNSRFALCPLDVFDWSYRFLEAIMCRCIPILNVGDKDILAEAGRFKFYRTNEPHVWREDWVEENLAIFLKHHTFSNPQHELNQLIASILKQQNK
jgi:hypothetical protein